MKFARSFFVVLLLLPFAWLGAQNTLKIKLTIFDSNTHKPLGAVNIIDPKLSTTFVTDGTGYAEHDINWHDTMFVFYPGYKTISVSVSDSAYKSEYSISIPLVAFTIGLNTVEIKAPKTLEQIEADRKKLGITPKELQRPIIQPFSSPISALYDVLSARAREREKLKGQIAEDDRQKVFKELLNYYNEKKLIDLPESHYEPFIKFCNLPIDYLKTHSDYDIMKTVTASYKKYIRFSGLEK